MNKYSEHSKAHQNQARQENLRCVTKQRFVTEDAAHAAASKVPYAARAYHCPMCLGFHLTSQVAA